MQPPSPCPVLGRDGGTPGSRSVIWARGWVHRFQGNPWAARDLTFWAVCGAQQESLACCDVCPSFTWRALQQWDLFKATLEAQSKCVPAINKKINIHIPQVAKQQHNRVIQSKQTPFKKQKSNAEIRQIRCKTTIRQPQKKKKKKIQGATC